MGGPNNRKKRILVVDDDIRTTQIFARMLREDGHDVLVAHGGADAISQLARSILPDILVTDFQMPQTDGFAVAQYARTHWPSLPIFFVTGYPERASKRAKLLNPMPRVFVKPLDYAALATALTSVMDTIEPARITE